MNRISIKEGHYKSGKYIIQKRLFGAFTAISNFLSICISTKI
jgi:hypothetical protein